MFPEKLSRTVGKVTRQAFGRKAAALGALVGAWESIAGPHFAAVCVPVKLAIGPKDGDKPAILHIAVPSAWKTELQHEAPLLIQRINSFFGYKAVGEIRLSPRTLPQRAQTKPPVRGSVLNSADIEAKVAGIEDPDLKAALMRLGQVVGTR